MGEISIRMPFCSVLVIKKNGTISNLIHCVRTMCYTVYRRSAIGLVLSNKRLRVFFFVNGKILIFASATQTIALQ